jgi:hypothetical protein
MAKFGDAAQVLIADLSLEAAQESVARVNHLVGKEIAQAHQRNSGDVVSASPKPSLPLSHNHS